MESSFPKLKNNLILRAALGEQTEIVPVWIMRQAGRYLPEFRELRQKHSFFEICRTPALACEATLMPIRRFNLDAAIIFSDILVIPLALGLEVLMQPGVGPVLPNPLKEPEDLAKLGYPFDIRKKLGYVMDAISVTRHALEGKVPLIGFSGAPWTLMGYMIEGGGSKTYSNAKKWLYKWPTESHQLLNMLTDTIVKYLVAQVEAGAQLLQVFESNAEYLTQKQFKEFCLPYLKQIRCEVVSTLKSKKIQIVPMIIFAKGSCIVLDELVEAGYDVISLDWTISPRQARGKVEHATLQGNLDPSALTASPDDIRIMVKEMLEEFGTQKYIANLGHGIYPDINPENVAVFIDSVHEISRAMNRS